MKKKQRENVMDAVTLASEITAGVVLGPGASTAVKLLKRVLTPVLDHVAERRERRAKVFVEEFLGSEFPSETAFHLLEAEMNQAPAETKDAVFDAVRAIDEVLSDKVVPSLALLARDYQRAGRPKDRFFVGTLRLLRDMDETEYEEFKTLVTVVAASWQSPEAKQCFIAKIHEPEKLLLWIAPNLTTAWEPSFDGLLHGLSIAGFADTSTGLAGHPGEEQAWVVERKLWNRLYELLGRR